MNELKKGFQPAPYRNAGKSFPRKYFHSNNPSTQGGSKPVNLATKKFGDNPREPLKCWECGETYIKRNCPCLNSSKINVVYNLQEASMVADVGRRFHWINASMDGRQDDHWSSMVEIEVKINNNQISVLIDPRATLSYITPGVLNSNKLKKMRHGKSWLVQLTAGTKRKVVHFIFDYEFSLGGQNIRTNLNTLPLGSYDVIIGMDWLERHKEVLDCYKKSLDYKDENNFVRTVQGIQK